ncbi:hypothetical protein [Oceanobacter mangrovi]|uniref:hypothetical protein n=1 Tax=Oceanobacter mangrovi TaxID=2862510 RepID=UPI001C8D7F51|nr:hypothetical protein [Oceanobacter mangrovi]
MNTYTLTIHNHSNDAKTVTIFQKPAEGSGDLQSQAWMTVSAPANTSSNFQWNSDYDSRWQHQSLAKGGDDQPVQARKIATGSESATPSAYQLVIGDATDGKTPNPALAGKSGCEISFGPDCTSQSVTLQPDHSLTPG